MSSGPYPWLTIKDDGNMVADTAGVTSAEADRRLIIMQEIHAGNLAIVDGQKSIPIESVQEALAYLQRYIDGVEAERDRLKNALGWLVALKDGPRDEAYEGAKPQAWAVARELTK